MLHHVAVETDTDEISTSHHVIDARSDDERTHSGEEDVGPFMVAGELVIDLRTRKVAIDLRPPDSLRSTRARHLWRETPTPTVTLVRGAGEDRVKRVFDVVLAVITMPLWVPLLAVLALIVKCTSRGPAFYVHERIGQHGQPLRCPKLRTMVVDADRRLESLLQTNPELRNEFDERFKLRCDPRVTRVGRVLRVTGLDELPQLWCALKGTMSWVGPRPIVNAEREYFGPYLPIVQSVRPGLTGLWQVSGRNDIPYSQRVAYEVEYVLTRGFWSDIRILGATIVSTLRYRGRGGY
jgi:lipopolysaccharide/colanic/teichoic acid biosynthesis glycosyltransferase